MLNDDSAFIPAEDIEEVLQTEAMQTFPDGTDDQIVVTQLSRRHPDEPGRPLGSLLQLYHHLKSIWVEPLKDKLSNRDLRLRETWVGELARDWFLTLHGVAVQDVPLFGAGPPAPTQDSQRDIRSSTPRPSSRSSMSSMSSTSSFGEPDEAFQRLQLLAPSLQPGKLGANRPAKVLSLWPIERGADPSDYMSSVAIASDMKFDAARQRQQRREAKRKALAEKYKRPRSMSRGESHAEGEWTSRMSTPRLPTPAPAQIMSSQQVPASSQSQGPMTMSQPVAGAFGGDRKKVRKTKKKSGFR